MAWEIEVFLKTGKLEYPEGEKPCKAAVDPDKLIKADAVVPTDNGLFTDEEATEETGRCIRCQCDACMKYCDVCAFHNKWPMRIRDDVMPTVAFPNPESIIKKTPGRRIINTCTQCGLCDEVCPENIEIGGMLLEARRSLHKSDAMPGVYHQFWVRDLEFTNSEYAALAKKAPGQEQCSYAFFPGCQLGAANPRYVKTPYEWLLSKRPDTGLILRCCGVPAEWAGNEEMHGAVIDDLRRDWEQLGRPVLILACPSCRKHLKEYLPEIETVTLYEVLNQWGGQWKPSLQGEAYSVFDPCSARHIEPLRQSVRNLAEQAGAALSELPKSDLHGCCGYGGNGAVANPDFASFVAKSRGEMSEHPYISYCINCRDIFKGEGKPVRHILDLLFDIEPAEVGLPNLTQRRRNRIDLKESLLKEIWGETMENKPEPCKYNIKFGSEILEKMDELKLLEEDVCRIVEFGETSKRRTFDPEKGTYSCYRESGHITVWVEYRITGAEYEIVNVYTHRMKIKLEGVWNGRKTEIDL